LLQAETGTSVQEICRKMGVVEIRRLKQLEEENAKLKPLVADLTLDKTMCRTSCAESGEARRSPRDGAPSPGCLRVGERRACSTTTR
jgi:hypothetical protein